MIYHCYCEIVIVLRLPSGFHRLLTRLAAGLVAEDLAPVCGLLVERRASGRATTCWQIQRRQSPENCFCDEISNRRAIAGASAKLYFPTKRGPNVLFIKCIQRFPVQALVLFMDYFSRVFAGPALSVDSAIT